MKAPVMKRSIGYTLGSASALICLACATGGADEKPGSGGSAGSGASAGASGTGGSSGGSAGNGGSGGSSGADASADAAVDSGVLDGAADVSVDVGTDAPGDASADAPGYDAAGCTGTPPSGGCAPGQYFHVCKNACVACADMSLLMFQAAPKHMASVSDTTGGVDQLFPRIGLVGSKVSLVFSQRVPPTSPTHRDFAMAEAQGGDWANINTNLGNFVNYPSADELAPVVVPAGALSPISGSASTETQLLMDSDRSGKREIYQTALFKSQGSPAKLAAPINAGTRDYHASYAHAATPPRMYWSSFRAGKGGLYTWALTGGAAEAVVLAHTSGCPVSDEDLEASITADGSVLVFSAPRRAPPDCNTPLNAGRRSLFFAYINPATGQALGPAVELSSLRTDLSTSAASTAISLRTPAFEPGACNLYFASDASAGDGDFDIYRATR
jgi:hypothetical protein